jgi:hypothetical protein
MPRVSKDVAPKPTSIFGGDLRAEPRIRMADTRVGRRFKSTGIKAIWGLPAEAKVDLALACSAVHPDDVSELDAVIASHGSPG